MWVTKIIYILITVLFLPNISVAQATKKDGIIELRMAKNDSMHIVTAVITEAATRTPLKSVELTFFVKRTFGLMKVGAGTTDSTGIVSAEFPLTIPGSDTSRNMMIVANVEDNAVMNDTNFQAVTQSPIIFPKDRVLPRAMIGSRAPWWLVITFSLTVGIVWFLFAFVVYLIYRIKKAAINKTISYPTK